MSHGSRQVNKKRKAPTESAADEITKRSRTEDAPLSIAAEFSDIDMSQSTQPVSQDEAQPTQLIPHDGSQPSLSISHDGSLTMKELSISEPASSSSQQVEPNAVNGDTPHKITDRSSAESASVAASDKALSTAEEPPRPVAAADTVKSLNAIASERKSRDACCVNCAMYYLLYP